MFDHARSTDDRPFLLHVSFTQPHNPFVADKKYWDMYEGVDIPEPEVGHIPYEERDPWAQRYYMTIRQDEFDVTPEQLYKSRRAYFAMVTHLDTLIGELAGECAGEFINIGDGHGFFVIAGDVMADTDGCKLNIAALFYPFNYIAKITF